MHAEEARAWIARTKPISGWLQPEAAMLFAYVDEVQKNLGVGGNLFEIGSYHGKSAVHLASLTRAPAERLGLCDIFKAHVNMYGQMDDYRPVLRANLERHWPGLPFVDIHAMPSAQLTKEMTTDTCRLFHVDGGHAAADVVHDLGLAASALLPLGAVVLDDIFNPVWPGVTEGFFEFMKARPGVFAPVCMGFNKLVLVRGEAHAQYAAAFQADAVWTYFPKKFYDLRDEPICGWKTHILFVKLIWGTGLWRKAYFYFKTRL